jgi:hypothetical protein
MSKEDRELVAQENVRLTLKNKRLEKKVKKLEAELLVYRAEDRFHNNVRKALKKVKK